MPARRKAPAKSPRTPSLVEPGAHEPGLVKLYPYQEEDIISPWRTMMSMQARQTGKTFGMEYEIMLICSMLQRARCVVLSASLRQGALNIQKFAEVWMLVIGLMRRRIGQDSNLAEKDQKLIVTPADDDAGRLLDLDAVCDLLEHGKLESKMFWSNAADNYSSQQIFAANPDTARGATADFIGWDEFATTPEFREVLRAIKHMMARRPNARLKMKGTPPISSDHESWELIYDENTYTPSPRGNWRMSNAPTGEGFPILRVDAFDAELAGIQYYNDVTGKPCTVAEYMAASTDKEGDGRELLLQFNTSGNACIPYSCLVRAQKDATGGGIALDLGVLSDLNEILSEDGLREALRRLVPADWTEYCTPGDWLGLGHDQSTSDNEGKSNPSALVVTQEKGPYRHMRLCVRWLSRFPRVNEALLRLILGDAMRAELRMRGFGIDASNETFHAQRLRDLLSHLVSVRLYKNGEKHPEKNQAWKDYLAAQYSQHFLDAMHTLPADGRGHSCEWLLSDHSLAVKGPSGVEWRTSKGNHADTFAAAMLAEEQLSGGAGPLSVTCVRSSAMHNADDDDDDDPDFAEAHTQSLAI